MHPENKLTIETPEQTVLEFGLAGVGSRALALLIDTGLQGAAIVAVGIVAGAVAWAGFLPQLGKQWGYAILIFAGFVVEIAYFAFFEAVWNGQTPGKRWTHLRVMSDSGRQIDAQAAVLRNLVRIVDSLPSLYAAGIITCLISPLNKRLGDYVAGTVVIHEKAMPEDRAMWEAPAAPLVAKPQMLELNAAELQLVEAFLDRRASFTDAVRQSMARQIAERLTRKSVPSGDVLHEPEKFLEALAEQSRSAARFR